MISIFDLFSIGLGPSSSHTIGPMRAGAAFIANHQVDLPKVKAAEVHLYGSLALTGKGHKTDMAAILGLSGYLPESIEPDEAKAVIEQVERSKTLSLGKLHPITFDEHQHLHFHKETFLPKHANALTFKLLDAQSAVLAEKTYYSIGGGFIVTDETFDNEVLAEEIQEPYPFHSADTLRAICEKHQYTIAEVMLKNELATHDAEIFTQKLNAIWQVMSDSIKRGCQQKGKLPGVLNIGRRAPALYEKLKARQSKEDALDWLACYAIAVNEENASGGKIVTAPTNGAAGIIPSVFQYLVDQGICDERAVGIYLLTAGAIAALYKKGASISAAEVGCQGEVGVACSMAAAAITAVKGGTVAQILHAAEMGMEHHLGLTCDPVAGLVQIPCIERNAMGATQAYHCANLALLEEGEHFVSLDSVIKTMLKTGQDMQSRYKETSLGGLAVNISLPNC